MHKIYNLIVGQRNEQLQEKAASDATFQMVKTDRDPKGYLMILKKICFSNQSEQHPIRLLFLSTRRLYNTLQYDSENTTDYLVRFRNDQKVNEACDGSLINKGVQEHGMKIRSPFHNTGFDSLQEDKKKEAEKSGEEMLCAILYLENSDKARFVDLKKRIENDYVLNKAEYPRMVTAVECLLINYQPNYNSHRKFQFNGVSNQLMFVKRGKTGDDEGDGKEKDQGPRRNLDHITCNNCGEKGHYAGNNYFPTQYRLKGDAEAFRK